MSAASFDLVYSSVFSTTGNLILNNGSDGTEGYCSKFSHKDENAKPGYYNVLLKDYNIFAELTNIIIIYYILYNNYNNNYMLYYII